MSNTINDLGNAIGNALKPLGSIIDTSDGAKALINGLGWQLPPGVDDIGLTAIDIKRFIDKLSFAINVDVSVKNNELEMSGRYAEVIGELVFLIRSIENAVNNLSTVAGSDYLAKTNILNEFLPRLLNFLITNFLSQKFPTVFASLKLVGLIDVIKFEKNDLIFQLEHIRAEIRFDRIPKLFSADIKQLPVEIYGWNTPDFDQELLLGNITALFYAFNGSPKFSYMDLAHESIMLNRTLTIEEQAKPLPQLYWQLYKGIGWDLSAIGILLYSIRKSSIGASDGGIGIMPLIKAGAALGFNLHPTKPLRLEIEFNVSLDQGIAIKLLPNSPPVFDTSFFTNPASVLDNANLGLTLRYGNDQTKFTVLALDSSLNVWFRGVYFKTVIGSQNGALQPLIEFGFEKGAFQIGGGKGDGLLQKILPEKGFLLEFSIAGGWSKSKGIYFAGSGSLEIQLPVHFSIGPIDVIGLSILIKPIQEGIGIALSSDVKASLGPLQLVVEGLGLSSNFTFPQNVKGNLGFLNAALGFKPPKGVGLSLDTGVVKGGGYLYFDFDKEEYAGVFELSIASIVTVKAIGLITTRMPDGSKGFSLLIIITAEFGTGIQLGFGFTLIGVGGLLGLNRTMLLEPLAAGIRTGAVNSIMFPPNPVENAPRIISDLRTYFPPYEGKFLIGPMIKIGWGTPTLVSLSFGLIIEIPGNIAIIGILSLNLPTADAPIVAINVAFLGALEFDKKRIWFFASLFDSRILFLTLEGDMGLLMDYGDNPNFVLIVGGFHPLFSPPPLPFPNPRRIHISVLSNPFQRITVESYFAVTSNTVQFGASAELFFGLAVVGIRGHFSFDALFQFSPFKFIIQMSFSVSLDVFGFGLFSIHLRLQLEGPTPWHAQGTGTLSIDLWLFEINISADFDVTWGDAEDTSLPPVEVLPLLVAELDKIDNWRATTPPGNNLLVSIRKLDEQSDGLVLHPLGSLQISQRAIPLHLNLDKVGNRKASDAHNFNVKADSPGLGNSGSTPQEKFAIAQFQDMSNDEKLTRPAFQNFDSGVELSVTGRQLGASKAVRRVVRYEAIIIDTNYKRFARKWFSLIGTVFNHLLGGAAVTKSSLSYAQKTALVPFGSDDRIKVGQVGYTVASITDNKILEGTTIFANEALARDHMQSHMGSNPGTAGEIHVIPAFEAIMN